MEFYQARARGCRGVQFIWLGARAADWVGQPERSSIVTTRHDGFIRADDYLLDRPWPVRVALGLLRAGLLKWGRKAAASADAHIANSTSVAERIRQVYGREARVVFPPVSVDPTLPAEPVPTLAGKPSSSWWDGHVDTRSAAVGGGVQGYARACACRCRWRQDSGCACQMLCVDRLRREAKLRWLYANARALISVSREDFGLTPPKNAFGTPVLLLRAGGFLDLDG